MQRRFDFIALVNGTGRDPASAAEPAWLGGPDLVPDAAGDSAIAALAPDATVAAMYEAVASLRLALIYCPGLDGEVRKGFARRLGNINLVGPSAAGEIELLRRELEGYETGWDDELHRDVAQIRHGLWRLRELCARYQELLTASTK